MKTAISFFHDFCLLINPFFKKIKKMKRPGDCAP
uniref:Uncharacterized protein n=1 Tax=Anguilla anguilla TaxID=7936 RepID=A0A0E9Q6R9_ANGAN